MKDERIIHQLRGSWEEWLPVICQLKKAHYQSYDDPQLQQRIHETANAFRALMPSHIAAAVGADKTLREARSAVRRYVWHRRWFDGLFT